MLDISVDSLNSPCWRLNSSLQPLLSCQNRLFFLRSVFWITVSFSTEWATSIFVIFSGILLYLGLNPFIAQSDSLLTLSRLLQHVYYLPVLYSQTRLLFFNLEIFLLFPFLSTLFLYLKHHLPTSTYLLVWPLVFFKSHLFYSIIWGYFNPRLNNHLCFPINLKAWLKFLAMAFNKVECKCSCFEQ